MIWIFRVYGTRNMHFTTEATLDFFRIFLCSKACNNMYSNFSTIGRKHECVQRNSKRIDICFQFRDSISPGQLILISQSISISSFNKLLIFKIFQSTLYLSNQLQSDSHSFAYSGRSAFLKDHSENNSKVRVQS